MYCWRACRLSKGGDDNLIVYVANCDPGALQIQNEDEFVQEAKKMVTKRR
jgi:hypothetical protein